LRCSKCRVEWFDEEGKYCPICRKLGTEWKKQVISKEQKIWIIISGYFCFFFLFYLFNRITLPFSKEIFLGMAACLFMAYTLQFYWAKSLNFSLSDFFPNYRVFLLVVGILILMTAILFKIVVDFIVVNKPIEYGFIENFTVQYFEGFIFGAISLKLLSRIIYPKKENKFSKYIQKTV